MDWRALMKAAQAEAVKAKVITDKAKSENRALTEEENSQVKAFMDSYQEKMDQANALKAEEEMVGRVNAAATATAPAAQVRPQTHQPQSGADLTEPLPPDQRVEVGQAGWERDPNFGFQNHRDFLVAVQGVYSGRLRQVPANLEALRSEPRATAGSDEHGAYSDPYGGFFIPTSMLPGLLTTQENVLDVLSNRLLRVPMQTPVVEVLARTDKSHSTSVTGGLRVYRRAEADTAAISRMQTEALKLIAEDLMGVSYATDKLLKASPQSFAAILDAGFRTEFQAKIMRELISGTGVGQLEGLLTAPAKIGITKETGQGSTFVYQNALKMLARIWKIETAIWLMNRTVLPQLPLFNVSGDGITSQAVWVTQATGPITMTLFGLPIIFTEFCKALGTEGDVILINPEEYLYGIYQPMEAASSVEVRFLYAEKTFRFMMSNCGMSWWRSALTPANGDTLSPIVTLSRS